MNAKFKALLRKVETTQAAMARELKISSATLNVFINHGELPRRDPEGFRQALAAYFINKGVARDTVAKALQSCAAPGSAPVTGGNPPEDLNQTEDVPMIAKQTLTPAARRKFGIVRDPFSDDIAPEDTYLSADFRFVLESMYQTAKHGGMLAVAGQSGSGKSTLKRFLKKRLAEEGGKVNIIEPYVLGMVEGKKQASFTASHLCEAIITSMDSKFRNALSPEAMFRKMHRMLAHSSGGGNGMRHLVFMEEAHGIPKETFRLFKRFIELEHNGYRLLSFIFIGQEPELKEILSTSNADLRELVQRIEIIDMLPLANVEEYVRHRMNLVNVKFEDVFAPDCIPALELALSTRSKGGKVTSHAFPLLVGNMLTRAINRTEEIKMDRVTAAMVQKG